MNFKNELVKNILFKAVNIALSFAVTVLIVRLLGAPGNGIYSLFIANASIIILLVSFSFNSGLTYYSAKNQFTGSALLNSVFVVLILQVLFIVLADKLFRYLFGFSFYLDTAARGLSSWGGLYVFAILLNAYISAIFNGRKWFDIINITSVMINIIFLIVFSILLFQKPLHNIENTVMILKIYISIITFQALLNMIILVKKLKFQLRFSFLKPAQFKLVFTYAGMAFLSNLFQFLAYRMDYWFVNYFQNKDELGLYALASKLNQVLWLLPMTMAAVIIPFTVTASEESMEKVKTIVRLQFNAYILLGVLLALTAPFLIPFFFSKDFQGTVLPFMILLPGVIVFTITTILAAYFAGINRQDINLKISFFCFFTILVGDLLLVPKFGKEGAAAASSIGYAISGFTSLYVFSKKSGLNFKELLLSRKKDLVLVKSIFTNKQKSHV